MKNLLLLFLLAGCASSVALRAQDKIDLSGTWRFAIDHNGVGQQQAWFNRQLDDQIFLPGSMPENHKGDDVSLTTKWEGSIYDSSFFFNPRLAKYRTPDNLKIPFWLTPDKHYIGWAWYQKDVLAPAAWKNKRVVLHMERPHVETVVWVNGKKVGEYMSHCVPHEYDVTAFLKAGAKNTITVAVDNTTKEINVGKDSHSITDQTQGNWNGIVGNIYLAAGAKVFFDDIQVYPNLAAKKATVKITVVNNLPKEQKGTITLSARCFPGSGTKTIDKERNEKREKMRKEGHSLEEINKAMKYHVVPAFSLPFSVKDTAYLEATLDMGDGMCVWDEFTPWLYSLQAELSSASESDRRDVLFGMREITIKGKNFYVNGRKTMLRGTVENCVFPFTRYAPMDKESWERVFRICKSYGLNHMRFHSYCPPEAAFIAADMVGFYLQPEGPSWPNHGSSLGDGRPIDNYLMLETQRLTKRYGNYASYTMLASGNEPRGRWVAWVSKFVDYWKNTDPRRVYTGASVGGSWAWQPRNQYHVKAGARGLAWGARPESRSDFRRWIDTVGQPFVSHETGQWCAFPNFDEIDKYTGVNKAKNFELFREDLADSDMGELGHKFMMASGKLQALCYKHEIEKTLRTPDYAGFQLLSLNDYSGQGTALVGVLDAFWDEKGYINAEQFRRFCSETVPLIRTDKFVYRSNETLEADVEVAHFGSAPLKSVNVAYALKDRLGSVYATGRWENVDIPIGRCVQIGKLSSTIKIPLAGITNWKATQLNLEVAIEGTSYVNDWDFFVYPAQLEVNAAGIYETDNLDSKAVEVLQNGGKVLLHANGKVEYGKDIVQHMLPVFWNTSWFKMRPPHTTGILVNPYHPVFADFPTDYHSNLQWWELVHRAQVMQLTGFPKGFRPLVQSIDTWFHNRKIGMLFEVNVLNGKLMVTSADLKSSWNERPVAQQLYASVVRYMQSPKFRPAFEVDVETVRDIFRKSGERINTYTNDMPDELKAGVR